MSRYRSLRRCGERGAVAVMVALLMVPFLAVCALAVDVSNAYVYKQRLQTGIDATALGIAADCLRGTCTQATLGSNISTFPAANLGSDGTGSGSVSAGTSSGKVVVSGTYAVQNIFGPILGVTTTTVNATATATYSAPTDGTAVLPLVVNACEFNLVTGGNIPSTTTVRTLSWSSVTSGCYAAGGISDSKLSSSYTQPGGFAWVKTTSGCKTASSTADELTISSSSSVPSSSCTSSYFSALQNTTVLLPVFDSYRQPSSSNTSNVYFSVYGYVPFRITGYYFGSGMSYNTSCNGSSRCLHGYFTRLPDQVSGFTYDNSGAQLGAGAVNLTQ